MSWLDRIYRKKVGGHLYAAHAGKSTLYKFRSFETETDRARVQEIIDGHKVYFSRASQLNDPFDLSPRFEMPTRKSIILGAENFYKRHPEKAHEREATLRRLKDCDLAEFRESAELKTRNRIERDYWVFSLAGNRNHPMLWSHYANKHTGLCIHFRASEGTLMGAAIKVTYQRERPTLPLNLMSLTEHEIFKRIMLVKGKFWAYEDEYRWGQYPQTDWTGVSIKFDGQHAHFTNPSELSGITAGARMSEFDIEEIVALAESHTPKLPVWRAKERDTFQFDFEEIV